MFLYVEEIRGSFWRKIQNQDEKIEVLEFENNVLQKHVKELKRANLDLQKAVDDNAQ